MPPDQGRLSRQGKGRRENRDLRQGLEQLAVVMHILQHQRWSGRGGVWRAGLKCVQLLERLLSRLAVPEGERGARAEAFHGSNASLFEDQNGLSRSLCIRRRQRLAIWRRFRQDSVDACLEDVLDLLLVLGVDAAAHAPPDALEDLHAQRALPGLALRRATP
eukprot:scaffold602_cov298-Pinguiococcus_pyrenoidosus.AAC.12